MSVETLAVVLHHSQATCTAKVVLLGIANHDGDGGAWPSIPTLMKYANTSERAVQNALRALEEAGELHTHLNGGGTARHREGYRPNRYEILVACPADCDRTPQHRVAGGVQDSTGRGAGSSIGGVQDPAPEPSLEPSEEPSILLADQQPALALVTEPPSTIDAEFTEFWSHYPRKVGKPAALKAYRAARKRASLEEIAAGFRAQLPDLLAREKHLVPHATTWLNQDRWADDPTAARQSAPPARNPYLSGLSPDFAANLGGFLNGAAGQIPGGL